jgi:C4-dicarboxylate-specific signal transduction histidine kinase
VSHHLRSATGARARLRSGWPAVSVQFLLALLLVAVTAGAVLSYTRMLTGMTERQMQNTADLTQFFLNQQNLTIAELARSVTEAADVKAALEQPDSARSRAVIAKVLEILEAGNPDVATVVVTDAEGVVLADRPAVVRPGYDVSDRPWFQQARSGDAFSVSPVFSSVVNGRSLTTISVPVRRGSTVLGVVAVHRLLTGYQRFVDAYSQDRDIRLSVIDGAGAVVADGRHAVGPAASVEQRLAVGRALAG